MRIKGFKIGKSKKKSEEEAAEAEGTTTEQIAEIEEKMNGRTKNLEETAEELKGLADEADTPEKDEDIPAGPHAPLDELTVEPEDKPAEGEDIPAGPHAPLDELSIEPEDKLAEVDDYEPDLGEPGEAIKVVEVIGGDSPKPEGESDIKVEDIGGDSPKPEGESDVKVEDIGGDSPKPEGETEAKVEDLGGDSINNLFSDEEDEENPLANLIKSLPDVTANELLDDLNEIQGIIKEWQKS